MRGALVRDERVLDRSLALSTPVFNAIVIVWMVPLFVGSLFAAAAIATPSTLGAGITLTMTVAICGLSVWLLARPITRLLARRQSRWLAALPLPFDRDAYLEALAVGRPYDATMVLTIEPSAPLDDDAGERLVHAAARGCGRGSRVERTATSFIVTSRAFKTRWESKGDTTYNNHGLHRWFRRAARGFLIPASRACPFADVKVEIR